MQVVNPEQPSHRKPPTLLLGLFALVSLAGLVLIAGSRASSPAQLATPIRNVAAVTPIVIPSATPVGTPFVVMGVNGPVGPEGWQLYGDFRLLYITGGNGLLPHEDIMPPNLEGQTGPVTNTDDEAVIRKSWLFKEPRGFPPEYSLSRMSGSGQEGASHLVYLSYKSKENNVLIRRSPVFVRPIDVPALFYAPTAPQPFLLNDTKALLAKSPKGSREPMRLTFTSNGILTTIEWGVTDPQRPDDEYPALVRVAESLIP